MKEGRVKKRHPLGKMERKTQDSYKLTFVLIKTLLSSWIFTLVFKQFLEPLPNSLTKFGNIVLFIVMIRIFAARLAFFIYSYYGTRTYNELNQRNPIYYLQTFFIAILSALIVYFLITDKILEIIDTPFELFVIFFMENILVYLITYYMADSIYHKIRGEKK